jgi:hypothetical protein
MSMHDRLYCCLDCIVVECYTKAPKYCTATYATPAYTTRHHQGTGVLHPNLRST